ncbi:MAG: hypothetical protein IT228_04875 [Flavobacteriales bacterium]|nr:hypothetical protein [Flavobacteriales bacterium]MCC6576657.1 hypothetical protein [Flavobacteriales bacterium]NUQ15137.1 hypothetical protein [Flavobacteriales bacterium]
MRTLPALLGALLLLAPLFGGCASQPPYGAKRKRGRKCDCPKWDHRPPTGPRDWKHHAWALPPGPRPVA